MEGVLGDIVAFNYLTYGLWGHLDDIIDLAYSMELELMVRNHKIWGLVPSLILAWLNDLYWFHQLNGDNTCSNAPLGCCGDARDEECQHRFMSHKCLSMIMDTAVVLAGTLE